MNSPVDLFPPLAQWLPSSLLQTAAAGARVAYEGGALMFGSKLLFLSCPIFIRLSDRTHSHSSSFFLKTRPLTGALFFFEYAGTPS